MDRINPEALGDAPETYSYGTIAGSFVFTAGHVGLDASGNVVGQGDVAAQTRKALENIGAVLSRAGANLTDIVSTTVYLQDFDLYGDFNAAWLEVFGTDVPPRATVRADLVNEDFLVEIQAIAVIESG